MLTQITDIARGFVGDSVSPSERASLDLLCASALSDWTARLLPSVRAEDCAAALVPASAFTALCAFLTARNAAEPFVAFSAGDVSLRCGESGRVETVQRLEERAAHLMQPYVADGHFAFLGVRG